MLSVKIWLSDALNQDLALGRSQSRPGSCTLSVKTWLLDALSQELALGRFHSRLGSPYTTSYNILTPESLITVSLTSLVIGPDFENQSSSNKGEYIKAADKGGGVLNWYSLDEVTSICCTEADSTWGIDVSHISPGPASGWIRIHPSCKLIKTYF